MKTAKLMQVPERSIPDGYRLPDTKWSINMPNLAQMTGSLHIHNFYIGKLKAKQEHLFEHDPELAMLLGNVAEVLKEHAEDLAEEIADRESDER
ncbi:hypothetical protein [Rhizobium leguminosarum]|uniref:hypothetical protein n=1 Tax=Rhizobium leguminosarum TaxID=384 RepID=UPI001FE208B6|nr:hypothetical protein [Rhizobium leguminosarum]